MLNWPNSKALDSSIRLFHLIGYKSGHAFCDQHGAQLRQLDAQGGEVARKE